MKSKYEVGDLVSISKKFDSQGRWVSTDPKTARIVEIKDTITYGPGYVLEVNGERLKVCYWEDDIETKVKPERLYDDPDFQWKMENDQ